MCTVTYIPTGKGAFLTSNRDERTDRAPAEPPITRYAPAPLTYPKDTQAGGTWIALKGRCDAAVLLHHCGAQGCAHSTLRGCHCRHIGCQCSSLVLAMAAMGRVKCSLHEAARWKVGGIGSLVCTDHGL